MRDLDKLFCFRIIHRDNLPLLIQNGIVNKNHINASKEYIEIGNSQIIDRRISTEVRIKDYGFIGDYVPFYFTPKSIMMYNINTGYHAPIVQKRDNSELIIICCKILELASLHKWFFTDGQANDSISKHFNNLEFLNRIDWASINNCEFSSKDGDFDRQRRYQAEFLVYEKVPIEKINCIAVSCEDTRKYIENIVQLYNISLEVKVIPKLFFKI